MGEETWMMLDIWIPAVRFTGIIGAQLRGRSTKCVLVDKMALDNSKHITKNMTPGERQVGQHKRGKESRAFQV